MILSDGETDIVIEAVSSGEDKSVEAGVTVKISVKNSEYDYSGACESEISGEEWTNFIRQLEDLDLQRKGKAILESDEVLLEFVSIDNVGSLGVKGKLDIGLFSFAFSPIRFDTTNFSKEIQKLSNL